MPKVAQRLQLQVLTGPHAGTYSTYVEETTKDGLVLALPSIGDESIELAPGALVRCEYPHGNTAYISFGTKVKACRGGVVPTVTLDLPAPDKMERLQRRGYVRLETVLPVTYLIDALPDGPAPKNQTPVKTRTFDLSGNGAMIWSPESLEPATMLRILLDLKGRNIDAMGEVVRRANPNVDSAIGGAWLGLRFAIIQEADREAIIKYIFAEQRERRRKGLL